ncbi:GNAT family N-acetyltransferase [Planctomycetes bacterium K23_9]|uniref:BioF2-like acetyltransferase domain-containing protein n=1 Tax=Stieleria marina TaxID=1930275 RepID=A0A517NZ17_9BACT|nr:hypothetical protein K239x_43770 [Planctomycetes bacterium K23_9]
MIATNQSADLTVRVVTDAAGFDGLKTEWNRLAPSIPFRSFRWHRAWWKHFGVDRALLILAVYDQETCVGIAPLFVQRILSAGRVAQFIGSGEVASDQQSILSAPNRETEVGAAIANWFTSDQNEQADLLQLDGIAPNSNAFVAFASAAQQMNYSLIDRSTLHTWRIDLPGSMDEYISQLSKSCRRKVRTAVKRFESGELNVSIASDPTEFECNWMHFVTLHQRRRTSLGDPGCFADGDFAAFLHNIAADFFRSGHLDMVCVSDNSGPIATEICFRDDHCSYAYQIGIDPDALKQNPGWLVNTASIRHAIELGLSEFDFCRGDFDYKRQLGAEKTACQRLRLTPNRMRSQVLNAAITGGTAMRNWCQNTFNIPATQ